MTTDGGARLPGEARAFIPELMRQGYSANSALAFLREQGAGMRRQTFLRVWGEVGRSLQQQPALGTIPQDAPRPASEMATWRAGRPGQYGYQVNVLVRDRPTGLVSTRTTYVFTPTNITPAEAAARATEAFVEQQQTNYQQSPVEAAYFVRGFQMLGRGAA